MKKAAEEATEDVFAGVDFGELVDLDISKSDTLITPTGITTTIPENKDNDLGDGLEKTLGDLMNIEEEEETTGGTGDTPLPTEKNKPSDNPEDDIDNAASSSTTALAIAKAFYEEGGLSSFDEEEFTRIAKEESPAKALMDMINKEVQANVEEYKKGLDPATRAEVEAKEMGINPQEYTTLQNDINVLENISDEALDSPEARASILQYYYKNTTKFSDERITKEIKRLEDLEEAKDEVKAILPDLIDNRKEALQELKTKAEDYKKSLVEKENKRISDYKQAIASTTEIIPGTKINKTTQTKIEDLILKPVKEVDGQKLNAIWAKRSEDSIKFDTILAYLMLEGVFDGKWSGIAAKPKTQAYKELENSLRTQRSNEGSSISNLSKTQQNSLEEMRSFSKTK